MSSRVVDHLFPTLSEFWPLRRTSSGQEFCSSLGVDKLIESSDLDVVPRGEREHTYGFAVVLHGSAVTVVLEPQLHMGGTNCQPLYNSFECP
jgi:hypothetical protein